MVTLSTDVLVIGGGATGAGVAWDAALRGFDVVLVDRADLAEGTSGRFHGLLHSGGRYAVKDPRAAEECIAENRILRTDRAGLRSRTPAGCSSPPRGTTRSTPTGSPRAAATPASTARRSTPAEALREEPRLNPQHLARVPRPRREHRRLEDRLGDGPRRPGARRADPALPRGRRDPPRRREVTGARVRDAAHRRGDRDRGARDRQRLRRLGRAGRRAGRDRGRPRAAGPGNHDRDEPPAGEHGASTAARCRPTATSSCRSGPCA